METKMVHNGVKVITDGTFEEEVLNAGVPVFVDFFAPWCGPCRMVAPIIEELAREYEGRVKFVKIDTDENPQVAAAMQIRSIPTLVIFKGRDVVEATIGARSKDQLRGMIERALGNEKPGLLSKIFG